MLTFKKLFSFLSIFSFLILPLFLGPTLEVDNQDSYSLFQKNTKDAENTSLEIDSLSETGTSATLDIKLDTDYSSAFILEEVVIVGSVNNDFYSYKENSNNWVDLGNKEYQVTADGMNYNEQYKVDLVINDGTSSTKLSNVGTFKTEQLPNSEYIPTFPDNILYSVTNSVINQTDATLVYIDETNAETNTYLSAIQIRSINDSRKIFFANNSNASVVNYPSGNVWDSNQYTIFIDNLIPDTTYEVDLFYSYYEKPNEEYRIYGYSSFQTLNSSGDICLTPRDIVWTSTQGTEKGYSQIFTIDTSLANTGSINSEIQSVSVYDLNDNSILEITPDSGDLIYGGNGNNKYQATVQINNLNPGEKYTITVNYLCGILYSSVDLSPVADTNGVLLKPEDRYNFKTPFLTDTYSDNYTISSIANEDQTISLFINEDIRTSTDTDIQSINVVDKQGNFVTSIGNQSSDFLVLAENSYEVIIRSIQPGQEYTVSINYSYGRETKTINNIYSFTSTGEQVSSGLSTTQIILIIVFEAIIVIIIGLLIWYFLKKRGIKE